MCNELFMNSSSGCLYPILPLMIEATSSKKTEAFMHKVQPCFYLSTNQTPKMPKTLDIKMEYILLRLYLEWLRVT